MLLQRNIKWEQRHQHILELQGHLDTKIIDGPNWSSSETGNCHWLTFAFVLSVIWQLTKGSLLSSRTFLKLLQSSTVQFSSVTQSCLTLCNPMNHSMPGLPVHHQLPEFTQTCIHRVSDAIQPSHPRSSPSPPAHNPSPHQRLFQGVSS